MKKLNYSALILQTIEQFRQTQPNQKDAPLEMTSAMVAAVQRIAKANEELCV